MVVTEMIVDVDDLLLLAEISGSHKIAVRLWLLIMENVK